MKDYIEIVVVLPEHEKEDEQSVLDQAEATSKKGLAKTLKGKGARATVKKTPDLAVFEVFVGEDERGTYHINKYDIPEGEDTSGMTSALLASFIWEVEYL